MAGLSKTSACLRIFGGTLDPENITRLLGHAASYAETKGQKITLRNGRSRIAKTGSWRRKVEHRRKPGDLDAQIQEILAPLTTDLKIWNQITKDYRVDMFCGAFLSSLNEGFELSPETLKALGDRGIKFGLDIYGDREEEED